MKNIRVILHNQILKINQIIMNPSIKYGDKNFKRLVILREKKRKKLNHILNKDLEKIYIKNS